MNKAYQIAVLPGDGIGREVMAASLAVLEVVQKKYRRSFRYKVLCSQDDR